MGAAVPNWAWLEDRGADLGRLYSDELFPVQPKAGRCLVSGARQPGLGVEIDLDVVNELPVSHWESPHLTRPDGSVTNW